MSKDILKRATLIRRATPKILEELFEMQNRKCDLCGEWIQDLIFAALDHSIPVILFARNLELSIEEAIKQANDLSNLRAVHYSCNSVKGGMTREEWFARDMDQKVGKFRIWTQEEIEKLRERFAIGGRKAGSVQGPKNAINKIGFCGRSPEKMSEDGRKGIRNQPREVRVRNGCNARDTGQLERTRNLPQTKAAFERTRNLPQTKAAQRKVAYANLEKGISTPKSLSKGGRIGGSKNVESGQILKAQALANHVRWHVNRGIVNPKCDLCLHE